MTAKTAADEIVSRYLTQLGTALRDIPAARRQPIIDDISEHIAKGRSDLDPEDEQGLRVLLDRVGDPELIAAEAAADAPEGSVRPGDAWVPWLLLAGGLLGFVVLLFLPGSATSCTGGPSNAATGPSPVTHCTTSGFSFPPAIGIIVFLVLLFAPIVTTVRLEAVRRR